MVRRLGVGKNNHLTYASLALNPRYTVRCHFFCNDSLSGLHLYFQIFEWWYFKKYGTSFIEQVSLNHISPLLGGGEGTNNNENGNNNGTSSNSVTNGNNNGNSQGQQSMPGRLYGKGQ